MIQITLKTSDFRGDHGWLMRGIPRFTAEDADHAFKAWSCNCGPGALAAICGKTLDEVHVAIPRFDERHYTNPTMMLAALKNLKVTHHRLRDQSWPGYGLCRIQWEGPWTNPGVPIRARYRYTHWVGVQRSEHNGIGIFDINCMNNGTGWTSLQDWTTVIVPYLVKQYPRASGKWHITHSVEVLYKATEEGRTDLMTIQQEITDWAEQTFGPAGSNFRIATRVNEEMTELLRAIATEKDSSVVTEEAADVMIVLYRLASRLNVDLDNARHLSSNYAGYDVARMAVVANTYLAKTLEFLVEDAHISNVQNYVINVAMVLNYLACKLNVSLDEEVRRKMAINRNRKWVRDGTGHGYHESES